MKLNSYAEMKSKVGTRMGAIELTPTDRQLLLYDIFKGSQQVELADITSRLPMGRKMIQRDMKTLVDAGLMEVCYCAKQKGQPHALCIGGKHPGTEEQKISSLVKIKPNRETDE